MPNLVGIGNSQVPTNAMLGGLAYQDSVGEIDIDKIKARTSDNALNIFVYDTRKDSDGGEWRYHTQNTSWYNEVVSAERGARREFPSVAVIVVTSTVITIYDGDDPNLPMWMVLKEGGNRSMLYSSSGSNFSGAVSALNGNIYYGMTGNGMLGIIEFVRDGAFKHRNNNRTNRGRWRGTIADRNLALGWFTENDINLAGEEVFDIATTVLPNAPIQTSTGLPVPTIAAATEGGTSIIKDNGTIVDIIDSNSGYRKNLQVKFTTDNKVVYTETSAASEYGWMYIHEIPSSDETITINSKDTALGWYDTRTQSYMQGTLGVTIDASINVDRNAGLNVGIGTIIPNIVTGNNHIFVAPAENSGITIIEENRGSTNSGLVAYATTSYNTGYQHGDIKGVFLADTDDTNLTDGNNVVNNGTFDSNVSGWYGDSGAAVSWDSGGFALVTNGGGDNTYAIAQSGILVVGKKYRITGRVNPAIPSGSYEFRVRAGGSGTSWNKTSGLTNGSWYSFDTGVVTADGTKIEIGSNGGNITSFYIDDVVVKEFDDDRSHNKNGLEVFGTITKTPVATGAELVAYSGWSSSNYFRQPYNSDLDFGTGDWSFNFWINPNDSSSGSVIMSRWSYNVNSSTAGRIGIYFNSGNVRFDLTDDGGSSYQAIAGSNGIQDTTGWHMVNILRRGPNAEMWVDGKLDVRTALTSTSDGSYTNTSAILEIGHSPNMGAPDSGIELALIRISKSAPTAEQIEKMYNDEKCLYHKNAKCTLHGTSDEVTGLAFDDTNNILHVGTSSGRSEFQGLNRINNTTTAVTTAISASNEFVAEQ